MHIYIDSDACPRVIKELLYKTVERRQLQLTMVAGQYQNVPESEWVSQITVPEGIDAADEKIVELCEAGDLIITSDIPLADAVISKGAFAINPRGELYTENNIKMRLAVRDLMADIRSTGVDTGGPAAYSQKDKERFANQLDRFLTKQLK